MVSKEALRKAQACLKHHAQKLDDLPDQSPDATATYLLTTAALSRPLSPSSVTNPANNSNPKVRQALESDQPTPLHSALKWAIQACAIACDRLYPFSRRHPIQLASQILQGAQSHMHLEAREEAQHIQAHNHKHGIQGAKKPDDQSD